MTDAQLLAAIQANATALAQANVGNDSGCAATIASTLPAVPASIDSNQLITWAASRGLISSVVAGVTSSNPATASACLAFQSFLYGGTTTLDLTNTTILGMLAYMTSVGLLPTNTDTTGHSPTAGSSADLIAFGSSPATVDYNQVSRVMLPSRPNGQVVSS
jgi:hypothetical protein